MKKSRLLALRFVTAALAFGWLLSAPGLAIAAVSGEDPLVNMELFSTNLLGKTFSKLDARGHLDGHILFTGCYLPDRCFRVVDAKEPENLVLLAEVPVFDPVESLAPPLTPVNGPGYKAWYGNTYNNLPIKVPCGDWKEGGPGWTTGPTCWDPG